MRKFSSIFGTKTWQEIGLTQEITDALIGQGFKQPTYFQQQCIPAILFNKQHNFIAAQTGTGKTLGYVLPMLQHLKQQEILGISSQPLKPRALIIVPTKELMLQNSEVLNSFKDTLKFKPANLSDKLADQKLEEGVDVCVTSFKYFFRFREQKKLFLPLLRHIIVDEADTLIDSGFRNQVLSTIELVKALQEQKSQVQLTFVSATYTPQLKSLFSQHFSEEILNKVIHKQIHLNLSNIQHDFIQLKDKDKNSILLKLLQEENTSDAAFIVFCNSVQSANEVEQYLKEQNFNAITLHGDLGPKQRVHAYLQFKDRTKGVKLLITTDLGSRGLDFSFVTHVIQFDFPKTISDYIHRAGRAGRAGRFGKSITLFRNNNFDLMKELQNSYKTNQTLKIKGSAFTYSKREKSSIKKNQDIENNPTPN